MRLEELINNYYNNLNENDLYIAKHILNHKDECINLGINDLAKRCNVSRTTIFRFAKKLGFKGYSEFKFNLKWEEEQSNQEENDYIEQFYTDVSETLKLMKEKDFTDICELIYSSERIFVYGTGTAQMAVAQELNRTFLAANKYFNIIEGFREFQIITPRIIKGDLVIIVSLSGDTTSLQSCINELSIKGIDTISITKLSNNLLSRMTTHNLYITTSRWNCIGIESYGFSMFFILIDVLFRQYIRYQERKKSEE
ncbi:MurR/RpiR family transcriptional regulator [Halonatronum saccharophilum]|uniref:MurR/RpiR family transcriptional regulator n=1 Tax=Halonatronum saccharophilum TaxID=150060 RepID=UPI0004848DFC|nr:MurR/RpiR family transcriptional regulator [Halonatronum saccharophilum]